MELSCSSWPMSATYPLNFIQQSHNRYRKQVSLLQGCCSTTSSLISANYPSSCSSSRLSASSFFGISLPNKLYSSTSPARGKIKRSFYVVAGVFEKFTERAIKAVVFSQWEARALGNDMVFKEHLLLGLIAEDRSPAGFLGSGITIDMARLAVKTIRADGASDNPSTDRGEEVGKGSTNSATDVPFSVGTKRIFEAAVEYSRINGHNYIAPEHIAIGLFSVDDGNVTRVLKRLGANINNLAAVATSRLEGELAKDGRDRASALKRPQDKAQSGKATPSKSEGAGNKKKTALDRFCVDLTARASERRIDPVIGRDTEVQRIIQILCRRTKNNPILLGDAGVGKTAIVEGLAMNIVDGNAPLSLLTKRIFSLDIGLLIAGAKERGELEERVTTLIMDIKKSGKFIVSLYVYIGDQEVMVQGITCFHSISGNIIVFIDEVHMLIGSGTVGRGNKGSGLDIANLLKPPLGRGEIQCIASTTMDEYRSHFEKDKPLARRFQPVLINEPSQDDAVQILSGLREKYEAHHKCRYTEEAINAAVYLSARYIPDRHLPDKAIDLIDEAGSRARMELHKRNKEQKTAILSKPPSDYWQEIRSVQSLHEVELTSALQQQSDALKKGDDSSVVSPPVLPAPKDDELTVVGAEEIAVVASLWSGIPVSKLTADDRMLLIGLNEQLKKRVVGQDEAVDAISRAVKRSRIGLKDPKRPIAAMLFCGPTGVGKTELAKALAACYFGSESAMLRLDMSEYMERHTVSKLIGSPPGYVGYDDGGTLTEAIRRRPFTVVLLDEIEKAHPDIFNILLQLFEDGHLTDSQGRRVSFRNALIVMTSNIGSAAIAKGRKHSIGFLINDNEAATYAGMKALVMEELKGYFRPELLNRIDEVVVFRSLEKPQMLEILDLMLHDLKERLNSFGIRLEVSQAVVDLICQQGFDKSYGARPVRRAITQFIEDPLSEAILSGDFKQEGIAVIDLDDSGCPIVRNQLRQKTHLSDTSSPLI